MICVRQVNSIWLRACIFYELHGIYQSMVIADATCSETIQFPARRSFTSIIFQFSDQCYKWVPYISEDVIDARMISTDDPSRIICRMQRAGNDIVCQYNTIYSVCFANLGNSPFGSDGGYPCQRLLIMEGCTVSWVPYIARDPIHRRAVIAGHMANGDTVYVTMFDYNRPPLFSLAGHYVEGAAITIGRLGVATQNSTTMMMLIMLWGVKVLLLNVLSHIFRRGRNLFKMTRFYSHILQQDSGCYLYLHLVLFYLLQPLVEIVQLWIEHLFCADQTYLYISFEPVISTWR